MTAPQPFIGLQATAAPHGSSTTTGINVSWTKSSDNVRMGLTRVEAATSGFMKCFMVQNHTLSVGATRSMLSVRSVMTACI